MKARKLIKSNLNAIKNCIISDMPNKFDSHEFIRRFAKMYENQYVSFLSAYKKNHHRKVHAQIALGLVENMENLYIKKVGKVESKNVFGISTENQEWIKV